MIFKDNNIQAHLMVGSTYNILKRGSEDEYVRIAVGACSLNGMVQGTTNTSEIQREGTTILRVKTTDGTNTVYSNNYNVKIDKTSPHLKKKFLKISCISYTAP